MFEPPSALVHHDEGVMLVRDLTDELDRSLDHPLDISHKFSPVESPQILDGDDMGDPLDIELQDLLVANKDGTVVENIEIRGKEGVRLPLDRIQASRKIGGKGRPFETKQEIIFPDIGVQDRSLSDEFEPIDEGEGGGDN